MSYNLGNYCSFSKVINDKEYANKLGIKVRKTVVSDKNLYMLNYDKSKLNSENIHTLGLFRSVITDGEKIVCFSPPKSLKFLDFKENEEKNEVRIENFVEGTMINLFYFENEWNCATKSTIGAKCKFFKDYPKTFRLLFLEAMEESNLEFDMLDKNYCYSFVVQHPENRIVVPFSKKKLFLIDMYFCEKFQIKSVDKQQAFSGYDENEEPNVHLPKTIDKLYDYKGKTFSELFEYFTSLNLDYKTMGVVVKSNGLRTKIWNQNYLKVKCLRGNNPKIQFQYYNLLKDKKLKEFLAFYPEYLNLFDNYKLELFNWTEQLWKNYKACYIRKEKPLREYPKQFRTLMFNIHQKYLNELRPNNKRVDKLVVIQLVNSLEPAQLMYGINYVYRNLTVDEQKSNLELRTGNLKLRKV